MIKCKASTTLMRYRFRTQLFNTFSPINHTKTAKRLSTTLKRQNAELDWRLSGTVSKLEPFEKASFWNHFVFSVEKTVPKKTAASIRVFRRLMWMTGGNVWKSMRFRMKTYITVDIAMRTKILCGLGRRFLLPLRRRNYVFPFKRLPEGFPCRRHQNMIDLIMHRKVSPFNI